MYIQCSICSIFKKKLNIIISVVHQRLFGILQLKQYGVFWEDPTVALQLELVPCFFIPLSWLKALWLLDLVHLHHLFSCRTEHNAELHSKESFHIHWLQHNPIAFVSLWKQMYDIDDNKKHVGCSWDFWWLKESCFKSIILKPMWVQHIPTSSLSISASQLGQVV